MKPHIFSLPCALVSAISLLAISRAQLSAIPIPEPNKTRIWTATNEVRGLAFRRDEIWAATGGGVVQMNPNARSEGRVVWSRAEGLPSNEVFEIQHREGKIWARFPRHEGVFDGKNWSFADAGPYSTSLPTKTVGGTTLRSTLEGLEIVGKILPFPSGTRGTHISAFGPNLAPGNVDVAFFGDGLWNWNGKTWRQTAHQPREVLAWAKNGATEFLGTRREGLWRREEQKWIRLEREEGPRNTNIQALANFGGELWASTLDDGLLVQRKTGFENVNAPTLSSSAPRQLLNWKDALWVRHGGGVVDGFNGKSWTKNALRPPRAGVYALGGDSYFLYASGWGGWAQWDGEKWMSFYDLPGLKGVPVLGILSAQNGEILWLATQARGVFRWTRKTGELRAFDERSGLEDDWITALAEGEKTVWVGTFVAGLARLEGDKWHHIPETQGQNVTAIVPFQGGVWATTRNGVWRVLNDGTAQKIERPEIESETQALLMGNEGVWIGGRTSLMFLKAEGDGSASKSSNLKLNSKT